MAVLVGLTAYKLAFVTGSKIVHSLLQCPNLEMVCHVHLDFRFMAGLYSGEEAYATLQQQVP